MFSTILLLLLLSFVSYPKCFVNGEVASFQTGKFNMSDSFQDWSCSSACSPPQHCHLPRCTKVPFPETFTGSGKASPPITWVRTEGD
ncbi:unnamed protein product [Porites evermanni]|uniref:Uncharacterized protein n=1 Tax=Porites evermanni TaxID=104178 RepID=A0ABN8MKD1_9CNID|nr:unnamed protein product [Porites evermanni]